jgi:nicotinamidase-related amidase
MMPVKNKFLLQPNQAALVVIDVQERLCAAMDQDKLRQLVKNTGILLESAQELAVPVIFTEQYVKGLGATLPELKEKAPAAACHEKMTFSCCGNEAFIDALRQTGRTQIIICGMETHVCVLQTVIDLLGDGYTVHVVKDAVISRSGDNKQTAIEAMTQAGAVPTCTESAVFQLLKVAGTDSFKKLSKLVK